MFTINNLQWINNTGVSAGSSNVWAASQTFLSTLLFLKGSGAGTLEFINSNSGATNYTVTFPPSTGTVTLNGTATPTSISLGNPNSTGSTSYVMMGLGLTGGSFTPSKTGTVRITMDGNINNSAGTGASSNIQLAYGTGVAPSNGAAATGTVNGVANGGTTEATQYIMWSLSRVITGLTPGTTYWFDLQVEAIVGGTVSINNVEAIIEELPF